MTALERRLVRIARTTLIVLAVAVAAWAYAWLLRFGLLLTFSYWLSWPAALALGGIVASGAAWLLTHPMPPR